MSVRGARVVASIEGLREMPISGLRMSNIVATAKSRLKATETDAMEIHDVQINAEIGPAFLIRESRDLLLNNIGTRTPAAGVPVVRLDHTPRAILRASRAFRGTGTFLSADPGELRTVALEGNVFTSASKPPAEEKVDFWKTAEPASEIETVTRGR